LAESNAILWYALLRYWLSIAHTPVAREKIDARKRPGYFALDAMERHLLERSFLVDEHYTIADISLYAYTHVAHEGDFDLSGFRPRRADASPWRRWPLGYSCLDMRPVRSSYSKRTVLANFVESNGRVCGLYQLLLLIEVSGAGVESGRRAPQRPSQSPGAVCAGPR